MCYSHFNANLYSCVKGAFSSCYWQALSVGDGANCDKITKQVTINLDFVGEEAYTHGCYLISFSLSFQ